MDVQQRLQMALFGLANLHQQQSLKDVDISVMSFTEALQLDSVIVMVNGVL